MTTLWFLLMWILVTISHLISDYSGTSNVGSTGMKPLHVDETTNLTFFFPVSTALFLSGASKVKLLCRFGAWIPVYVLWDQAICLSRALVSTVTTQHYSARILMRLPSKRDVGVYYVTIVIRQSCKGRTITYYWVWWHRRVLLITTLSGGLSNN